MPEKCKPIRVDGACRELAVEAWRALGAGGAPQQVELLKGRPNRPDKGKSLVYRLAGPGWAVVAKRCSTETASFERRLYQEILPEFGIARLRFHGFLTEPDGLRSWLFIDDAGDGPYRPDLPEHRVLGAHWLACLHTAGFGSVLTEGLADRGPDNYRRHMLSGCATIRRHIDNPALSGDDVAVLEAILAGCSRVEARWDEIMRRCAPAPLTVVHGDFAARNIRVRVVDGAALVCPLDWEHAGRGMIGVDLYPVDLPAYHGAVRETWPHLDLAALEQIAGVGRLFRYLGAIDWMSSSLRYEWVEAPMNCMRLYAGRLFGCLTAAGWDD
jgi:hypothetical protein